VVGAGKYASVSAKGEGAVRAALQRSADSPWYYVRAEESLLGGARRPVSGFESTLVRARLFLGASGDLQHRGTEP